MAIAHSLAVAKAKLPAGRERPGAALAQDPALPVTTFGDAVGLVVPSVAASGWEATNLRKSPARSTVPATDGDKCPQPLNRSSTPQPGLRPSGRDTRPARQAAGVAPQPMSTARTDRRTAPAGATSAHPTHQTCKIAATARPFSRVVELHSGPELCPFSDTTAV